uniref:Uncharacterized protein n=1 Tax=Chromera velia CCMP2878 TaxID=1169474 RepID=A0A0G4FIH4_9ALVE|eukprot:Cvel_17200.t1-p1 / transcript=Cvel_17200.t1 / gene=Cvel_17200 / organism=Chromera_velia_CCMP2878 / gene_product=hypothetical protein / transcript_product=hypothetical protein / location=Cvel_scaffold1359:45391-47396(+) / protein_length=225 / sequence_SO=supercontig / SO=protein_coding / is_pseudo=false
MGFKGCYLSTAPQQEDQMPPDACTYIAASPALPGAEDDRLTDWGAFGRSGGGSRGRLVSDWRGSPPEGPAEGLKQHLAGRDGCKLELESELQNSHFRRDGVRGGEPFAEGADTGVAAEWALSNKTKNRLAHAYNGNTSNNKVLDDAKTKLQQPQSPSEDEPPPEPFAFENLPADRGDPLWVQIAAIYGLSLPQVSALKNARCPVLSSSPAGQPICSGVQLCAYSW